MIFLFRNLFSLLIFLACFILTACTATPALYKETQQKISDVQQQTQLADKRYRKPDRNAYSEISARSITLNKPASQPGWMTRQVSLQGNDLSLEFMTTKLLANTGALVAYEPDVNKTVPLSLNYSGSIAGALDSLAAKTGYGYEVHGNTVTWSAFVSRTFDVSFMPGASEYLLGGAQASSGSSGSSSDVTNMSAGQGSNQYSSLTGALSVWNDLKQAMESLKSKDGTVMVSEATTTVTVRDRPENVRLIGEYLAHMGKSLSRQVRLDVQVLEVALNKGFNYGIDWNLIRRFSNGLAVGVGGSPTALSSTALAGTPTSLAVGGQAVALLPQGANTVGGAGIGLAAASGQWAGTSMFINALSQQGEVSVSTQPSVVTLNNQVAEIGINTKTSYLARVTSTVSGVGGTSSTSLTPGIVTTGFSLYILPKIQGNDVYLQITSTLSTGPTFARETSGTGTSQATIQLPKIAEKRFNQRSAVPSGSTLVLAGFKQINDEANSASRFGSNALGGRGAQKNNTETIVLITPTILRADR